MFISILSSFHAAPDLCGTEQAVVFIDTSITFLFKLVGCRAFLNAELKCVFSPSRNDDEWNAGAVAPLPQLAARPSTNVDSAVETRILEDWNPPRKKQFSLWIINSKQYSSTCRTWVLSTRSTEVLHNMCYCRAALVIWDTSVWLCTIRCSSYVCILQSECVQQKVEDDIYKIKIKNWTNYRVNTVYWPWGRYCVPTPSSEPRGDFLIYYW